MGRSGICSALGKLDPAVSDPVVVALVRGQLAPLGVGILPPPAQQARSESSTTGEGQPQLSYLTYSSFAGYRHPDFILYNLLLVSCCMDSVSTLIRAGIHV